MTLVWHKDEKGGAFDKEGKRLGTSLSSRCFRTDAYGLGIANVQMRLEIRKAPISTSGQRKEPDEEYVYAWEVFIIKDATKRSGVCKTLFDALHAAEANLEADGYTVLGKLVM